MNRGNRLDRQTPWWISLALKLAILAGWCYIIWHVANWIGVLISLVGGMAVILPRYILQGVGSFAQWASERALHEWDGEYLEFDGHHLRAWRLDNELWMSANDIACAMALKPFDPKRLALRLPADTHSPSEDGHDLLLNEAGVRAWLEPMTGHDTAKFRRWMERDVLKVEAERRRRRMP